MRQDPVRSGSRFQPTKPAPNSGAMSLILPVSSAEFGASSENATLIPSLAHGVTRNCGLRTNTMPLGPQ